MGQATVRRKAWPNIHRLPVTPMSASFVRAGRDLSPHEVAEGGRAWHWIALAVWAAVAVLVKYVAALIFLAIFLALLATPAYRRVFADWRLSGAAMTCQYAFVPPPACDGAGCLA